MEIGAGRSPGFARQQAAVDLDGAAVGDGVDADAFLPTQIGLQEFRKMVLEVVCH